MNILDVAYTPLSSHDEKMFHFNQALDNVKILKEISAIPNKIRIRSKPDKFIPGSAFPTGNIYINTHWLNTLHELLFVFLHETGHIVQIKENRLTSEPAVVKDNKLVKPPVFKYRSSVNEEFKEFSAMERSNNPDKYEALPWENEVNRFANTVLMSLGFKEFIYNDFATRFKKRFDVECPNSIPNLLKSINETYAADRDCIQVGNLNQDEIILIFKRKK